ncbi:hypothetical protein V8E51_011962 [Hyaloscypha variabilis]
MIFKHILSLLIASAASNILVIAATTIYICDTASTTATINATASTACNADSCLRAIQASAFPTRHGVADCSSYFVTTVTPATVTVTATASYITSTTTSGIETELTTSTATSVILSAAVSTFTTVSTSTLTFTSTVDPHQPSFKKRDADKTSVPSSIPAYASPCSGAIRYSSACSCVGATKTTITAAAPTSTVTVTQTSTDIVTYASTETELSVTIFSTTATFETSTTVIETAVASASTSVLSSPTCTALSTTPDSETYNYNLVYSGFQTLNPVISGQNILAPDQSETFSGEFSLCDAANACIEYATTVDSPIGGAYLTTNLQYEIDHEIWNCLVYYDQASAADYNVDTPGISESFGWVSPSNNH